MISCDFGVCHLAVRCVCVFLYWFWCAVLVGPFGVGLCSSVYARNVAAFAAAAAVVATKFDERNGIADTVEHEQTFEVPG